MGIRTSQLTEITTVDNADLLYGVDVSDLTHSPNGSSRKFTKQNLLKEINTKTSDIDDQITALNSAIEQTYTGWNPVTAVCAYQGADSPTFTMYIAGDATLYLSVGMRFKLTQTTAKYFIITALGTYDPTNNRTLVTMYGGTDYTLENSEITLPYFSTQKAPYGFPTSPSKWTYTPTTNTTTSTGYVSLGTINLPIGAWYTDISARLQANGNSTYRNGDFNIQTNLALSTSNNSFAGGYKVSVSHNYHNTTGALDQRLEQAFETVAIQEKLLSVTVKTTLYLVCRLAGTAIASGFADNVICNFICAYL